MQDKGHIVKGKLHGECSPEDGCGEKYEVGETGQIVELERDEAVIIPDAFDDKCFGSSFCKKPDIYTIKGTIAQIAGAINQLGGGVNFAKGAKVIKNGRKVSTPKLSFRDSLRNPPKLQSGSVVINRTNMLNPETMSFTGTLYSIASDINSYDGNGVALMENGGKIDADLSFSDGGNIEYSEKQIAKIIEKATKRQHEFSELMRVERNKKNKHQLPLEIATMVVSPFEQKKLIPIQREQLLSWAKVTDNMVKFIVAFSGGKDSIAMVLHLMFQEFINPSQIELWHHDVDGKSENLWDWKCTESYCRAFAKAFGLKILFSYREGGITKEILKGQSGALEISGDVYFQEQEDGEFIRSQSQGTPSKRLMFPAIENSLDKRWCSALVKIDVMKRAINNMDSYKNANLIICTGERRLESGNRATYMEIEPYRFANLSNQITWRPVIDYTEQDVWDIMQEFSVQPHPAYEVGFSRCSCQLCIFNQKNQWATINEISPEKVAKLADIEKQIGNTLFNINEKAEKIIPAHVKRDKKGKEVNVPEKLSLIPTGKKKGIYEAMVNEGRSLMTPEIKKRWILEVNGEFVSPIIVPEGQWKLPIGAFRSETCGAS